MSQITSIEVPDPIDIIVGAQIKNRRKYRAISQPKLAAMIGVSWQQLNKYESGENRVSASRLWKISKALGVKISYFFEGVE